MGVVVSTLYDDERRRIDYYEQRSQREKVLYTV